MPPAVNPVMNATIRFGGIKYSRGSPQAAGGSEKANRSPGTIPVIYGCLGVREAEPFGKALEKEKVEPGAKCNLRDLSENRNQRATGKTTNRPFDGDYRRVNFCLSF